MERTLLFIDPDPATRLLVERVLSPEGFCVLHARTALEGQEFAARILPDLILVDVDRARVAELVPALRRCPGLEHVRLVASTAHAWPDHIEKMLALGFDRAFVEPLDIDTLAQELRECLPGPPVPATGAEASADGAKPIPSPAHADGNGRDALGSTEALGGGDAETGGDGLTLAAPDAASERGVVDALCTRDGSGGGGFDACDGFHARGALDAADGRHVHDGFEAGDEGGAWLDTTAALEPHGALDDADDRDHRHGDEPSHVIDPSDGIDLSRDIDPSGGIELSHGGELIHGIEPSCGVESSHGGEPSHGLHAGHGIEPSNGSRPTAEQGESAEQPERLAGPERGDAAPAIGAAAASAAPLPVVPLEPVEVPSLWRLGLTPLTAALVRATGATDGLLALLSDDRRALVIVAGASNRQVDDGTPIDAGVPIGTRVLVDAAPWLERALQTREATVLAAGAVEPSPLAPAGSQALLAVPVASRDKVHGLAVLGKHHASRPAVFGTGKIAAGLSQGRQLAGAVEMLRELDRASGERRREVERLRVDSARAVLKDVTARVRRSRRTGAGGDPGSLASGDAAERLGAALAERLGLSARQREVLAQALPVRDVGKEWLERVLLARTTLSVAERARVLEASAEHGAEILGALGWPPAVVRLVRVHRASWNGAGWPAGLSGPAIPVEARIMAVVSAFAAATARRASDDEASVIRDVLAELHREAGRRYDPAVVDALIALALPDEALNLERG